MAAHETKPNVRKAVNFFTQAGLSRLLAKLRQKYIELGQVGGQLLLEDSTAEERRNIASFLGKPPYPDASFKVRLVDVEKAVKHSFNCTLPEVLADFFPGQHLVTRQQQRVAYAIHQADFRTALLSIAAELPVGAHPSLQRYDVSTAAVSGGRSRLLSVAMQEAGSRGRFWFLQGLHGQEWLFSRYKNAPLEEQEQQLKLVRYIVSVLDQLPGPDSPERLALFAQRTSGDPHMLDPDRPAGRLFLLALNDLANDQAQEQPIEAQQAPASALLDTTAPTSPQNRAHGLQRYMNAGLLVDTISSSVAVFNLVGAINSNGLPDPLLAAAGKRVLLLPLRQLLEWQSALPSPYIDIYIFENPQVFEAVIAALDSDTPSPTLICTSGWPSTAAMKLLNLIVAQSTSNRLYYSGDFDLKGLQIASYLMTRYPGRCHAWRFDPDAYAVALQAGGITARASELKTLNTLPDAFDSLVASMQEQKRWAYQEGITQLLIADVMKQGCYSTE